MEKDVYFDENDAPQPKKRRKRRSKEVIEAEKREKAERAAERLAIKEAKELEAATKKAERLALAAAKEQKLAERKSGKRAKRKVATVGKKEPIKDELDPVTVKGNNVEGPSIIIVWKDARNRSRQTEYVMAELSINESIAEEFAGKNKKTRIHLNIDGSVLKKN